MYSLKVFPFSFSFFLRFLIFTFFYVSSGHILHASVPSVLAEGDFYKIAVTEKGIYKLDGSFLSKIGINVNYLNPEFIKLYGNGGGMLPQKNSDSRPDDLKEISIFVSGGEDGRFDDEDYLLFYAEGPHQQVYDEKNRTFRLIQNLYSDENYYFLHIGSSKGKRIEDEPSIYGTAQILNQYNDFIHHENDLFNLLNSGRTWYGEEITDDQSINFQFKIPGLIPTAPVSLEAAVLSQSAHHVHFNFSLNRSSIGKIPVRPVPEFEYADKGMENKHIFETDQIDGEEAIDLEINIEEANSLGYLNYFSLNFFRELGLYESQTFFRSLQSLENLITEFQFRENLNGKIIWDVSDHFNVKNQAFKQKDGKAFFKTFSHDLKEFVVFDPEKIYTPVFVEKVANQNLHGMSTPDLLIITCEEWLPAANRLAEFRTSHDYLQVQVVTTAQIYNEFSSGRQDVTAIRDFTKHLYRQPSKEAQLRYVLLLGDASYAYKGSENIKTDFIPVYQSINSLHNALSYSSDDYYGFMEDEEGEWPEITSSGTRQHTLDISIGRLPVTNTEEAHAVVDKLIHYSTSLETLGAWRNQIAFVADDGDQNKHQQQSNYLATLTEKSFPWLNPERLFIDAYPREMKGDFKISPMVRGKLNDQIKNGLLILDYMGHGGETAWSNEEILDLEMIKSWKNYNRLPLILSATCEFGKFDDPARKSGAEEALLKPDGGAIALFTTTRPVFPNAVIYLNSAFYNSVFEPKNGEMPRLGDVFLKTKNAGASGNSNRNFSLLGDPSMKLAYPENDITITHINGNEAPKTVQLTPLGKMEISGEIRQNGVKMNDFDGILDMVVYGKPSVITTLGDGNNIQMQYENRQDIIFKGKATVKHGNFNVSFIASRDLDEEKGVGKLSFYASHKSEYSDAVGFFSKVEVGGEPENPEVDKTPPGISLYMDFEEFKSGGVVSPNPVFYAKLNDNSGINTNNSQGNGIKAYLNNDMENPIDLSSFYSSDIDTYQSGSIVYSFSDLPSGRHDILLEVADNYNNKATAFIEFFVVDGDVLFVHNLKAYPNPSRGEVHFKFRLDNINQDTKVKLNIFSSQGDLIAQLSQTIFSTGAEEYTLTWDRKNHSAASPGPGIYFYQFLIESPQDQLLFNTSIKGKIILLE